jgi:hypothetical protein
VLGQLQLDEVMDVLGLGVGVVDVGSADGFQAGEHAV